MDFSITTFRAAKDRILNLIIQDNIEQFLDHIIHSENDDQKPYPLELKYIKIISQHYTSHILRHVNQGDEHCHSLSFGCFNLSKDMKIRLVGESQRDILLKSHFFLVFMEIYEDKITEKIIDCSEEYLHLFYCLAYFSARLHDNSFRQLIKTAFFGDKEIPLAVIPAINFINAYPSDDIDYLLDMISNKSDDIPPGKILHYQQLIQRLSATSEDIKTIIIQGKTIGDMIQEAKQLLPLLELKSEAKQQRLLGNEQLFQLDEERKQMMAIIAEQNKNQTITNIDSQEIRIKAQSNNQPITKDSQETRENQRGSLRILGISIVIFIIAILALYYIFNINLLLYAYQAIANIINIIYCAF